MQKLSNVDIANLQRISESLQKAAKLWQGKWNIRVITIGEDFFIEYTLYNHAGPDADYGIPLPCGNMHELKMSMESAEVLLFILRFLIDQAPTKGQWNEAVEAQKKLDL